MIDVIDDYDSAEQRFCDIAVFFIRMYQRMCKS